MRILFVNNKPYSEILSIIKEIKENNIEITYGIMGSVEGARKYIESYGKELDLIVTSLSLPITADVETIGTFSGLIVLDAALINNIKAPIIIKTTDKISFPHSDYLKNYSAENNIIIEEVEELTTSYLIEFIKKHQIGETKED